VDNEKLMRERQKLMINMLENKIRLRARQLYEERGRTEGKALEDWVKAESEVLESSILAPLWSAREDLETPRLQRNPAARHRAEYLGQRFRSRRHALFLLYLPGFIRHATPVRASSQVQSDGQFLLCKQQQRTRIEC